MAPRAIRRFKLVAAAGDFVHLAVEQDEIDVVTRLLDPTGALVVDADRIIGDSGLDFLWAVTKESGEYTVEIRAFDRLGDPGRIVMRIAALRPAYEADLLAAERFAALRKARSLSSSEVTFDRAVAQYQQVIEDSFQAGDGDLWSEAKFRLGFALRSKDRKASRRHLDDLAKAENLGRPIWRIRALETLAVLDLSIRQPQSAIEYAKAALEEPEITRYRFRRARLYHFLAQGWQQKGDIQNALDAYRRAEALYRPWHSENLGQVRHNLGVLHRHNLGQPEAALDFLRQAMEVWRSVGRRQDLASSVNQIAASHEDLDDLEAAVAAYHEALQIRRELNDRCAQANTLVRLALLDQARGQKGAGARTLEARGILKTEQCNNSRLAIRSRLAIYAERAGFHQSALTNWRRVLKDPQAAKDRYFEAQALGGLARACWVVGSCSEDPLELTEQALAIVEDIRSSLAQETHRLTFGSRIRDLFDLRIDLQWERGEKSGSFVTAEKARARALLDRLRQIDADIGSTADAGLVTKAKQLHTDIRQREKERLRMVVAGRSDDRVARLGVEVDGLVDELDQVDAEINRQHPEYFRLLRAEPADLGAVQKLLDADSALLAYRLGEERSYLWVVIETEIRGYELPPRKAIELEALRIRDQMKSRSTSRWSSLAMDLLTAQVLPEDGGALLAQRRRWYVVADGALEQLPFAALSDRSLPDSEPQPLLAKHEIVHLPSAAAWVELRSRGRASKSSRTLAMVADPVYDGYDKRLPARFRGRCEPTSGLRRLHGSGREADGILSVLPDGTSFTDLRGSWASRETVLGGVLNQHRFVHFSGHGVIHPRQPALSYLALAECDSRGQPIQSRLFAHELYSLEVSAELVVLAGCETGLGPLIPGEGLVSGLARGFLYAGARQVMVSLWPISDAATPELMVSFYSRLLNGDDAVTALHEAQQALYKDNPPHVWAGFVLQGD